MDSGSGTGVVVGIYTLLTSVLLPTFTFDYAQHTVTHFIDRKNADIAGTGEYLEWIGILKQLYDDKDFEAYRELEARIDEALRAQRKNLGGRAPATGPAGRKSASKRRRGWRSAIR